MRRPRAHLAKIIRRRHKRPSKMKAPNPVHHHPRRQRILGRRNPLRQPRPRLLRRQRQFFRPIGQQNPRRPHPHRRAFIPVIPTLQHVDRRHLFRVVLHCVHRRQRQRNLPVNLFQPRQNLALVFLGRLAHRKAQLLHLVFQRLHRGLVIRLLLGRRDDHIVRLRLRKVALQPVVIGLPDRVKLVVVATRATHRHAQHSRAHNVRHLRQHFRPRTRHVLIARVLPQRPQPVKTARHQQGVVLRVNLVPGQLLLQKHIVRLIGIERRNHIVPEPERVRPVRVVLVAIALGEPHHVQPMPRPLFAIPRRIQQPVHQLLICIRPLVRDKRRNLLRRRRQPVQVKSNPPNQRRPVRLRSRRQLRLPQPGQHKRIDRRANPRLRRRVLKRGNSDIFPRLKRPVPSLHSRIGTQRSNIRRGPDNRRHQYRANLSNRWMQHC